MNRRSFLRLSIGAALAPALPAVERAAAIRPNVELLTVTSVSRITLSEGRFVAFTRDMIFDKTGQMIKACEEKMHRLQAHRVDHPGAYLDPTKDPKAAARNQRATVSNNKRAVGAHPGRGA